MVRDREAWYSSVHGVRGSQTRFSGRTTTNATKKIREKENNSWKLKSRIANIENTIISLEYKAEQHKKGGKSELKYKKSTATGQEIRYQEREKVAA